MPSFEEYVEFTMEIIEKICSEDNSEKQIVSTQKRIVVQLPIDLNEFMREYDLGRRGGFDSDGNNIYLSSKLLSVEKLSQEEVLARRKN